ncbi:MAG TPA: YeeE/YedE thiosulfate transporter family protein, partial [Burkholderiaceae bacterium]|nr:YeeE/YedE thiosulfate transporter family protein [Burkholderiaceae bacterium]
LAGALVGVGTRLANGCTSGHGLCGACRGSKRSIVATVAFFGVAVVTATLTGQVVR